MAQIEYTPFWSETSILLGSGAIASLGVPTTYQMGRVIHCLSERGDDITIIDRLKETNRFYKIETELGSFLQILGDSLKESWESFTEDSVELAKKILPDNLTEEKVSTRISQWRAHYDWNALRRLALKIPVESNDYAMYLTDLYNTIDGNLSISQGVPVYDEFMNKKAFLQPYKLRSARNLLILLCNLMIACSYYKTREEYPDAFKPYIDFTKILYKKMIQEAIDLDCLPYNRRLFYLMSYSFISFNFDPIFIWFRYKLNYDLNLNPAYIGKDNIPVRLYHDFASYLAIRDNEDRNLFNIYYPVNETIARHQNGQPDRNRLFRVSKFYFVHGCTNMRECDNCGKESIIWGDMKDFPNDLFLAPPFKTTIFKSVPHSVEEKKEHDDGSYDAIQCSFCGNMTYANNSTMIMQSSYKGGHSSFIEEIQRDAKVSIAGAKHILLLGYSFPPDDVVWRNSIIAKQQNKDIYCSVVVGYLGEDKWIEGEELTYYIYHVKNNQKEKNWVHFGIKTIETAISIFKEDHVRAYTGGIPNVWCSDGKTVNEERIKDLLYPQIVFPDGITKTRSDIWERIK